MACQPGSVLTSTSRLTRLVRIHYQVSPTVERIPEIWGSWTMYSGPGDLSTSIDYSGIGEHRIRTGRNKGI